MALKDDVREYIADARDALNKAGSATRSAVEKIGSEGKAKLAILQAEGELNTAYAELGRAVADMVQGGRDNISRFEEPISSHLEKIAGIRARIKAREAEIGK